MPAPKADSNKKVVIAACAVGGVLLVILIIVLSSGGDKGPSQQTQDEAAARSPAENPYNIAWTKANGPGFSGPIEDVKRFADMAWDKHQSGEGSAEDQTKYRSHWRKAYRVLTEREEGYAVAHERLGDVLFDRTEAVKLAEDESINEDLRDDISILVEELDDAFRALKDRGRIWLNERDRREREFGEQWKALKARVDSEKGANEARESDGFYGDAQRMGENLARELAAGAVDFRIDGVKDDPFAVHVHKPYVFLVQRSSTGFEDRIARQWNDVLQELLRFFYTETGDPCGVPAMNRPTPVLILAGQLEYTKYQRRGDQFLPTPVDSAGHFEPGNNRLVCYRSTDDEQRSTLFHEGLHQIVNWAMLKGISGAAYAAALGRQSLWFSEGFADYHGGAGPGKINTERVATLGPAKSRNGLMPIEELLEYSRFDYMRDKPLPAKRNRVLNGYAQGWALCYLLRDWKKDKYGAKWNDYVKEEFRGRSGRAAFVSVYGEPAIAEIQRDFNDMIDALSKAMAAGKIVRGAILE